MTRRRSAVLVAAALLCLAAPPAGAATWHLPWHLGRWFHRDKWIAFKEPQHRPVRECPGTC